MPRQEWEQMGLASRKKMERQFDKKTRRSKYHPGHPALTGAFVHAIDPDKSWEWILFPAPDDLVEADHESHPQPYALLKNTVHRKNRLPDRKVR